MFFLEFTKESCHRLSGCSDHLGNLFVGEGERDFYLSLSVVMACGKIKQEAGQLLAYRMGESNVPHFCDCGVIGFTQLLRHAQPHFAVLAEKAQEFLTGDKVRLGWFDHFCGKLIRFFSNSGG